MIAAPHHTAWKLCAKLRRPCHTLESAQHSQGPVRRRVLPVTELGAEERGTAGDHTRALLGDQSHSIRDNVMALLGPAGLGQLLRLQTSGVSCDRWEKTANGSEPLRIFGYRGVAGDPLLGVRDRAARVTWELDGFDRGHGLQPGQQIARSYRARGGY
jgi:hypothetical protein